MPQVMKTNVSQFMLLQDELKMLSYIVGFIRNTQVIDKNIIALCVAVTTQLPTVLLSLLHSAAFSVPEPVPSVPNDP